MTDVKKEAKVAEKKTRKPSTRTLFVELIDNEGNVMENVSFEKNVRVIADFKKVDESVIEYIKNHPHAFFAKL